MCNASCKPRDVKGKQAIRLDHYAGVTQWSAFNFMHMKQFWKQSLKEPRARARDALVVQE